MFYCKNVCSKQLRGCYLVYSSRISIVCLKFAILQKLCSKQAAGCFLVYNATFLIQKIVFKTSRRLLFSLLIINKYYTPEMF